TIWEFRGADGRTAGATYALAVVVLAMFLVCFVAASAFITMAQRRTRQFGLLAATGATDRHVRLIMLAAGATTGTVAAALGAARRGAGGRVLTVTKSPPGWGPRGGAGDRALPPAWGAMRLFPAEGGAPPPGGRVVPPPRGPPPPGPASPVASPAAPAASAPL